MLQMRSDNHTPTRLIDLCITYVAKNLKHVESFVDFPDRIGEQIFSVAVLLGVFEEECRTEVANMRLFCEAYGLQVLRGLNLSQQYLVINNYTETICTFTALTELDLSSCGLGDDHPLLAAVANIDSLLVFGLRDNALSDEGVRRMTSPIRMFRKGPLGLQKLDISDNSKITMKGVVYLKVFTQLQLVDLSRTSVKPSDTGAFEDEMEMVQLTTTGSAAPVFQVQTAGWAATVIQAWIHNCQRKLKVNASKPKRSHFYRRISRSFSSNVKSDTPSLQTMRNLPILILKKLNTPQYNEQTVDDVSLLQTCDQLRLNVDNSVSNNSITTQKDCDHTKQAEVVYSKHLSKKRKRSNFNHASDSEDEDEVLMALYSGLESRKQCCFADVC